MIRRLYRAVAETWWRWWHDDVEIVWPDEDVEVEVRHDLHGGEDRYEIHRPGWLNPRVYDDERTEKRVMSRRDADALDGSYYCDIDCFPGEVKP